MQENQTSETPKILVKVGRPSTYNSSYVQNFLEHAEKGLSIMEIASELKISRDTLYRWVKEHKDFGDVFKMGKEWSEAKNATIIKMIALGQIPKANVAAYQMYMRNTAGWDKFQNEGGASQTININNMNVLGDKSTTELLEYIKNTTEELGDIIDVEALEILPDGR